MRRKLKTVVCNGVKTNFQMQTICLHKGIGIDTQNGNNDTIQHIYCGSDIDDDFASVRFYDSDEITELKHRRFNVISGVSADFIVLVPFIPSSGIKKIYIEYASDGYFTKSSDEALININFDSFVRNNTNGVIQMAKGLEPTVIYENGKFKMWYSNYAYANHDNIHYQESFDGINWINDGLCVTNHGRSYVYKHNDGFYYMIAWDYTDRKKFDLYRSMEGTPDTWALIQEGVIVCGVAGSWDDKELGNICFWYENEWKVLYEASTTSDGLWRVGLATGVELTSLIKHGGNPVIAATPGMVGGTEVHKINNIYHLVGHSSENTGNTPTSLVKYHSSDLITWYRDYWLLRIYYDKLDESQLGDPTILEANGKVYLYYESLYRQVDTPNICLATWDTTLENLIDSNITYIKGDDLEAEGWVFESGYEEVWPDVVFRKLSENPDITPVSALIKTDSAHQIRVRKPINTPYDENTFYCTARAEQTNKKFVPFRLDKDANNTIICEVYFDTDGNIKYYNGITPIIAQAYTANTYYNFKVKAHSTGYDLYIDGVEIATNIPYYSTFTRPQYFKVELDMAAEGWINTLYTVQYSDPSTEPTWGTTENLNLEELGTVNGVVFKKPTHPVADIRYSMIRKKDDSVRAFNLVIVDQTKHKHRYKHTDGTVYGIED